MTTTMRRIFASVCVLLFCSATAFAEKNYGPAGCGLGLLMFGKKDHQIFAATFNYSSFNGAFAMSSGTSGCTEAGVVPKSAAVHAFIESNTLSLENDIGQGSGESLASLAELLGCQNPKIFAAEMQKNFETIFPISSQNIPSGIENRIESVIESDSNLRGTCQQI